MKIVLLSNDINLLQEWNKKDDENELIITENLEECKKFLKEHTEALIIADYDSYASEINKLISSDQLCDNLIVLEKIPEILTGKQLISHGIKAYGNSRMLKIHYKQMIQTVASKKIWTYPELTVALAQTTQKSKLSTEAQEIIEHRLTEKEKEVLLLILEGLTNDAIAKKLDITTRTVKAHVSSIFTKLHVNDRVALVLLLIS